MQFCDAVISALCVGLSLFAMPAAYAETATIEIQAVSASDPGAKQQSIPASLSRYKAVLQGTLYSNFTDLGSGTVKPACGGKDSTSVIRYTIDVTLARSVGGKAKVEVTIKHGAKAIAQTIWNLAPGEPVMMQVGQKDAPTILIFTLKSTD